MANITVLRNNAYQGDDEGSMTLGFRYVVTSPFHTETLGARSIVIANETDYPVAVTFSFPIGNGAGQPIAAHDDQQFHLPAAPQDDYSYTVMVNENGTMYRAHAGSNPKIVYP
jgi:hypothetical protein